MRVDAELSVLPYTAPDAGHFLDRLIDELQSDRWTEFRVAVAFASRSGNFPDLIDALASFAEAGNTVSLTFYARRYSDQSYASHYEAVEALVEALDGAPSSSVHLYVQRDVTFHPKVYLFANEEAALLFVGSSNWGQNAWIQNVEANVELSLDLTDEESRDTYERLVGYFNRYWTELDAETEPDRGEGFAREVTSDNLEVFEPLLGKREDEKEGPESTTASGTDGEDGDGSPGDGQAGGENEFPEGFFDGERFPVRVGRTPAPRPDRGAAGDDDLEGDAGPGLADVGSEIWVRRSLPVGDAQRPASPNTHPHGRITLVQDRYEVDGERINPQRYFRHEAFGDEEWERLPDGSERAVIPFEVIIHEHSYGVHELEVMHVPEWEAGQSNFTTEIRWGPLNPLVRTEVDVRGDRLTIYAPPEGEGEPYFLVIERT